MNITEANATATLPGVLWFRRDQLDTQQLQAARFLAERAAKPLLMSAERFWPADTEGR